VVISVLVAGIAVILAAAEGAETPIVGAVFAAAFLAAFGALSFIGWHAGRRLRAYGITDRRLLVFYGGIVHTFGPDEVSRFDFDRHPDGSVDLFWGRMTPEAHKRSRKPEGAARRV
jgi:hypothetical protein